MFNQDGDVGTGAWYIRKELKRNMTDNYKLEISVLEEEHPAVAQ